MKSAYELAMEKLEKQSPTASLSDSQKAQIAEIDSLYRSKIAEREVFLRGELDKARAGDDHAAVEQLEKQLSSEIRRLRSESESKKEQIRNAALGGDLNIG